MDIETFKRKCITDISTNEIKSKEWHDLEKKQILYGNEYIPKHKLFRGDFCPNCGNKLEKIFMFRNKNEGFNYYIYKCLCGYKYAYCWFED